MSKKKNNKENELNEQFETLIAEKAELNDRFLRLYSEFENYKKRTNKEKIDLIATASEKVILGILPIIDDFERAIQAGENGLQSNSAGSVEYAGFLEGVKMIEKRLTSQLEAKWGLKRFNSAGEIFDPNLHEALMMDKSPDVTEATVQEDFQKGYFLKERVIRAAKVKVLMPETN